MQHLSLLSLCIIFGLGIGCSSTNPSQNQTQAQTQALLANTQTPDSPRVDKPLSQMTEADWKQKLTPKQYYVLREKGTERAFTGKYWNNKKEGVYACAGCGTTLFTSNLKYESGCGWPSFFDSVDEQKIQTQEDRSFGMLRTEILCAKCGGHLGHVFRDGPPPTGLRYCVNSASLTFTPASDSTSVKN